MTDGTLIDHGAENAPQRATWIDGPFELKESWFSIELKAKRLTVTALRCPACGFLELYAR